MSPLTFYVSYDVILDVCALKLIHVSVWQIRPSGRLMHSASILYLYVSWRVCLFDALCLPFHGFINCEYLDLLEQDFDLWCADACFWSTSDSKRLTDLFHLAKKLVPQCQSSSVFPLLYLFLVSLLSVSPSSPRTVCKSALNHSLTERGEGEGM